MCEHEGQPCPGRSCRCDCMNCPGHGSRDDEEVVLLPPNFAARVVALFTEYAEWAGWAGTQVAADVVNLRRQRQAVLDLCADDAVAVGGYPFDYVRVDDVRAALEVE